jgi:hypothetical protein
MKCPNCGFDYEDGSNMPYVQPPLFPETTKAGHFQPSLFPETTKAEAISEKTVDNSVEAGVISIVAKCFDVDPSNIERETMLDELGDGRMIRSISFGVISEYKLDIYPLGLATVDELIKYVESKVG